MRTLFGHKEIAIFFHKILRQEIWGGVRLNFYKFACTLDQIMGWKDINLYIAN